MKDCSACSGPRLAFRIAGWGIVFALNLASSYCIATVVDSGPVNIPIPATSAGVSLDLITGTSATVLPFPAGWDFSAYATGGNLNLSTVTNTQFVGAGAAVSALVSGVSVGPGSAFATGILSANAFRISGTPYIGFRFTNETTGVQNYGYAQISTTAPSGFPATITRYVYENTGAAIAIAGYSRLFRSGFEAVVKANSCSASDVQAALTTASDGDTVLIPPGVCDWGSAWIKTTKGVWLKGAGKGLTTLQRTAPVTEVALNPGTTYLIDFDCMNSNKKVEVSDISFIGNDDLQSEADRLLDYDDGLRLENSCVDFKIHDAEFSKFSISALTIQGTNSRGVIYWSDFVSDFKCQPYPLSCEGYGVSVYGVRNQAWPALSLGSQNAVFVEDSYFRDDRHGIASNEGSRYVLRNSTLVTTQRTRDFGMIDAHGRNSSYPPGSRSWELYNNTLKTEPASMIATGISLRGGDGVIFGNSISSKIPAIVWFSEEGGCATAWPVLNQTREAHIWGNDWQGPPPGYEGPSVRVSGPCTNYIRENIEYFLSPRPNYAPYAYPHPLR